MVTSLELRSNQRKPSLSTINDVQESDENILQTGDDEHTQKQRLDRYLSFIPTLAFGSTLQAAWESLAISFQAGLLNGGPTSLVYGTVVAWVGTLAIAASLAEMASIHPTVGAQYHWASTYAPRGAISPAFWGLFQGWITVFAWLSTCAQPAFINGNIVQGLIILNHQDYVPKKWHCTLFSWAFFSIPVLTNVFARKALASIQVIGGITHLVFFLAIVITLVVMAPRSSPEFVFETSIFDLSGWQNHGVQWCIGLLSAAFPLAAFDGILHMSDEVNDAHTQVPLSMVIGLVINGSMSLALMITLLFCLGDPGTALTTPTGFPLIQILYGATGSKLATTIAVSAVGFNGLVAQFSTLASVSRLVWAFARDNGLPCSKFFGYVHPTLRIPLNTLALVSVWVILVQIVNIFSTTALFSVLGVATMGLYLSYIMPILFFAMAKIRKDDIRYGPFNMGKWGIVVNIFALVYGIFILIWLPFPPFLPVNGENMNYGGPFVVAALLLAIGDWFWTGKQRFKLSTDKR